jgi:hypothetical protein
MRISTSSRGCRSIPGNVLEGIDPFASYVITVVDSYRGMSDIEGANPGFELLGDGRL